MNSQVTAIDEQKRLQILILTTNLTVSLMIKDLKWPQMTSKQLKQI